MLILEPASVFGFWVNYGVQRNVPPSDTQWRIPFAVQMIPGGLLVIMMTFAVESPRWLIKRGRHEQATKSLTWVRNLPGDHAYVLRELAEIRAQVESESSMGQGTNTWRAQWNEISAKGMRNRIFYACLMKWMQNFAG